MGRFVAKFAKFGRISIRLAVQFLGWPFGASGTFYVGHV